MNNEAVSKHSHTCTDCGREWECSRKHCHFGASVQCPECFDKALEKLGEVAVEEDTLPKVLERKPRRFLMWASACFILAFVPRIVDLLSADLEAFVINSLTNPVLWAALVLLRFHFRAQKHEIKSPWAFWLYLLFATVTFFVFAAGISFLQEPSYSSQATPGISSTAADPIDPLSSAEKARFREIIAGVVEDPDYLTPVVHTEFWSLLNKTGPLPAPEVQQLRDTMTGILTIYHRYFYEDALWALKTGRPFKSLQREEYEKDLLSRGEITEWRIQENETLIAKIAAKEAIPFGGTTIVLSEDIVNEILAGLEDAGRRIDALFSETTIRNR